MALVIIGIAMIIGAFFVLAAAIGLLRLPDLYTRMHAATKAGTMGLAFLLFSVALYFQSLKVYAELLIIIGFIYVSAPIAAHLLARAAYKTKEPLYNLSQRDALATHYRQQAKKKDKKRTVARIERQ